MRISIVGRLTGPKGDVAYRILSEVAPKFPKVNFVVAGGPVSKRFKDLQLKNIKFYGFVDDVKKIISSSNLVIGAGRVAVETIQLGKPILAIGEKRYIGIIDKFNITEAQVSNFGDCDAYEDHDFQQITEDIEHFINSDYQTNDLQEFINQYNPDFVMPKINQVYSHALSDTVLRKLKEVSVLMYHRVVESRPAHSKFNVFIEKKKLEEQIKSLIDRGFEFITFKDLANGIKVNKPIILTFDDGYEDNYNNLLPLLKKYTAKAVIFCLGNRLVENNIWDEKLGEAKISLMSNKQIKECHDSGLVEIASHGLNHNHMTKLSDTEVKREFEQSKTNLERIIDDKVFSFAYPYGDYSNREKNLANLSGYHFAIGTVNGPLKLTEDFYAIRRIQVFPNETKLSFLKKTSGFYLRLCRLKGKDF